MFESAPLSSLLCMFLGDELWHAYDVLVGRLMDEWMIVCLTSVRVEVVENKLFVSASLYILFCVFLSVDLRGLCGGADVACDCAWICELGVCTVVTDLVLSWAAFLVPL